MRKKKQTIYKEGIKYHLFGLRLRRIMLMRDKTNYELANALYVTPSTISGYRNGRRSPDVEQLALLARELDVSADYLLGLSDDDSRC